MRQSLLIAILMLPALAYAETTIPCESLKESVSTAFWTPEALALRLANQTLSAETCAFDTGIRCKGLRSDDFIIEEWEWSAGTWSMAGMELKTSGQSTKIARLTGTPTEFRAENVGIGAFHGGQFDSTTCSWTGVESVGIRAEQLQAQAEGLKVNGLPVSGDGSLGLLPPRYATDLTIHEASAAAMLFRFEFPRESLGLGLGAYGSNEWFGAGVVLSQAESAQETDWLSVQALWGQEPLISAVGELGIAADSAHRLGFTAFEGSDDVLRLRLGEAKRLDHSRGSSFGLSLRGTHHSFTLFGESSDYQRPGGLGLLFEAASEGPLVRSKTQLLYLGKLFDSSWVHSINAGVGLTHRFGRGALALEPGLNLLGNFGVVPTEVGFEGSTSASLLPELKGEINIEGRFSNFTHILRPKGQISYEVYGFSQRGLLNQDAAPFEFTRRPGLHFGWAGLEQELESRAFGLRVPIGMYLDGDAVASQWGLHTGLRVVLGNVELGADFRCPSPCEEVNWRADSSAQLSRLSAHLWLQNTDETWLDVSGLTTLNLWRAHHTNSDNLGLFGGWNLEYRFHRFRINAASLTDADSTLGVLARARWVFDKAGYALGVTGVRTTNEETVVSVGFDSAP